MAEKELAILVVAKGIAKATGQILTLDRKLQHLGKATRNASANIQRGIAVAATAAGAGIVYATKQASDFEAQLFTINTIARQTTDGLGGLPDGLDAIGDVIRGVSTKTGTPLEELTQGFYDLLSAGIKSADAPKVLNAANTLAIGGLASTAEAVDLLTTSINTYGGDASQAGHHSDVFAKAVERGKVTASDIANSFANVGPIAATMGIEIEEIAAGYARLTANGSEAGEASTQMASAMTALLKKTGPMEKLEKATNKNYAAIAGSKGLGAALQEMRTDAENAGIGLADLMGRKEGLLYLLQVTGPNLERYNEDLAAMGDAGGTAAEQMAERQKGLNFQLQILQANLRDAAITVGTELLPIFVDLAQQATSWLQGHQPQVRAFAKDLAAGIRDAVSWMRQLDWNAIIGTLKAGAAFTMGIVNAFLSAPPWVQQFLATGFLANKFTGGVIGDILGDVAKGFIKGVLGINAAVVNVNAATVKGPGGIPGVGGAGAAAGAGLGVLGVASLAALVAAVVPLAVIELTRNLPVPPPVKRVKDRINAGLPVAPFGRGPGPGAGRHPEPGKKPALLAPGAVLLAREREKNQAITDRLEANRIAMTAASRSQVYSTDRVRDESRHGASSIVAAINAIPVPIVNVSITGRSVTTSQISDRRSGSRHRVTATANPGRAGVA